jgi:hypothetical protein
MSGRWPAARQCRAFARGGYRSSSLVASGIIGSMTVDYASWLRQVGPPGAGDPGARPLGADRLLRQVFDRLGPISVDELRREVNQEAMGLARTAADRVRHDVQATIDAHPVIEVRDDDDYGPIVSYNGGYTTAPFQSLRHPEATCEIADYLQGEIVQDVWAVWPICPAHQCGVDARPSDGEAYWYCRAHNHQVAVIGQLAP